uniref:ABC transmembrane type-1 domain-containing protein n=1 Tax=Caenorhabditis japonica TaxID=281687 RepID=A0A8R1DNC5_CAEJA
MLDNDPKHTSGHIKNWFQRRRVDLLDWPSQSPDLNPIEHLWEELERRVQGVRASSANQKFDFLEASWKDIPMSLEEFRQHSGKILDTFIRCRYSSLVANRWLAVRLEFVGNCIIFFAALFSVLSKEFGWVTSPGIIGVSVSYALNITEVLNFAVRQVSEIEANIVSVERVDEYTHTPNEAEWRIAGKEPSAGWPSRGVVKFDKYSTRYREGLDLVLKGISADVAAGEKIGIVGRTGAGHFTYFYGTVSRIGNVGGA